jgi:hypothetical protein
MDIDGQLKVQGVKTSLLESRPKPQKPGLRPVTVQLSTEFIGVNFLPPFRRQGADPSNVPKAGRQGGRFQEPSDASKTVSLGQTLGDRAGKRPL